MSSLRLKPSSRDLVCPRVYREKEFLISKLLISRYNSPRDLAGLSDLLPISSVGLTLILIIGVTLVRHNVSVPPPPPTSASRVGPIAGQWRLEMGQSQPMECQWVAREEGGGPQDGDTGQQVLGRGGAGPPPCPPAGWWLAGEV